MLNYQDKTHWYCNAITLPVYKARTLEYIVLFESMIRNNRVGKYCNSNRPHLSYSGTSLSERSFRYRQAKLFKDLWNTNWMLVYVSM